jgi:hypothetical protein
MPLVCFHDFSFVKSSMRSLQGQFVDTARELEVDESGKVFESAFSKVAKAPSK